MHRTVPSGGSDGRITFQSQHQRQISTDSNASSSIQLSESGQTLRTATQQPFEEDSRRQVVTPEISNSYSPTRQSVGARLPRRSSSISSLRDGIGNLNRWSQSTSRSKASHSHRRSNSSGRISFGGGGGFSFGLQSGHSSTKSYASGHSTGDDFTKPTISAQRPSERSSNWAPSLPPILTLPALDANHERQSSLTEIASTPSTVGILNAAVRSTVPDYFGKTWEQPGELNSTTSRSPLPARSPLSHPSNSNLAVPRSRLNPASAQERIEDNRGHSRNGSTPGRGSGGTLVADKGKTKERISKQPSQKAMLSKALQKANTAVLLDNAQNFEGAMQAYSEACNLLQQVMQRSSGDDDKRKLEAIRNTYTSRIQELKKITPQLVRDSKALPARPDSGYRAQSRLSDRDSAIIETATVAGLIDDDYYTPQDVQKPLLPSQLPKRRESLLPSLYDRTGQRSTQLAHDRYDHQRAFDRHGRDGNVEGRNGGSLEGKDYTGTAPSPRRDLPSESTSTLPFGTASESPRGSAKGHARSASVESMSWLDTIDESNSGSTASSMHSRTSSFHLRRQHSRAASGATEAEFDAALDAAVEAAYDDGLELTVGPQHLPIIEDYDNEVVLNARRKVELAKERVRQTERETSIQMARDRERFRTQREQLGTDGSIDGDEYDGNESDEEERMLEEMTRDYLLEDIEFGMQTKSAMLPRESDSSGFSGHTWDSSLGSNPTTAGTPMLIATEKTPSDAAAVDTAAPPPIHPPPTHALPPPPPPPPAAASGFSGIQSLGPLSTQSVRSRRLSGQNAKQLKIETVSRTGAPPSQPPSIPPPQAPASALALNSGILSDLQRQPLPPPTSKLPLPPTGRQVSSPLPGPSSEIVTPPTPSMPQEYKMNGEPEIGTKPSPSRAHSDLGLGKRRSSSSLQNLKTQSLAVNEADEISPSTPLSTGFGISPASGEPPRRIPTMPTLPTPVATAFRENMTAMPAGGIFLFNSDLHSPVTSVTGPVGLGAPIPLEPCPKEFLLRPFWLMRALYETIAHPRGGYLSTKLFVPRDVWRVKGVKIKGIEDKISNCDYLTAALQKLSRVDTYDADLVLDEMQSLEAVLEQVQATLIKKLGNEVGVQNSGYMFGSAADADGTQSGAKTPGAGGKSTFSWRRLRSKNSGVGLTNAYSKGVPVANEVAKDSVTMSTLPMTSLATSRIAKRDISQLQCSGPHANYMAALARLFDAAQVIDQIARQVEDPGLRHADKTQVGLELSTRHASEFFGFYICRFVLADVSLLLDKFIKRGSEWVAI